MSDIGKPNLLPLGRNRTSSVLHSLNRKSAKCPHNIAVFGRSRLYKNRFFAPYSGSPVKKENADCQEFYLDYQRILKVER